MAIPDFQSLMLPVLLLVEKREIESTVAVELLSKQFKLSTEERTEMLPSGKMARMTNRVYWAITCLVKAGLAERPRRGTFKITNLGSKVLSEGPDRIDFQYLSRFESFREFRAGTGGDKSSRSKVTESLDIETPEERIDVAFQELDIALRTELLERITEMKPFAFEKLIVGLMVGMGYGAVGSSQQPGSSRDGGVDGVINQDVLGLDKIYLQAKRYAESNPITIDKIREFAGAMDVQGATKGVFVTTSRFVSEARKYAQKSPKRLILIDGEELTKLLVEHGVGVRRYRTLELKRIDSEFFDELEA